MVDDFGTGIGLETFFPGRDEGSMSDDFAGGVDDSDVFENGVGDGVYWFIAHGV